VPKRTIDELLAAIEAVQVLQQTVAKHDQAIEKLIDKLDEILRRLDSQPHQRPGSASRADSP
jgi:uncharacterized coiled-coil protein SlyX